MEAQHNIDVATAIHEMTICWIRVGYRNAKDSDPNNDQTSPEMGRYLEFWIAPALQRGSIAACDHNK